MAEKLLPRQILAERLNARQQEATQGWISLMTAIRTDVQEHEFPYVMPVGKDTENLDSALVFVKLPYPNLSDESSHVMALTPDGPYLYEITPDTRRLLYSTGMSGMNNVLNQWLENPKRTLKEKEGVAKSTKTLWIHAKGLGILELERDDYKINQDQLIGAVEKSKAEAMSKGKVANDVKEREEIQTKIGKFDRDIESAQEVTVFVLKV